MTDRIEADYRADTVQAVAEALAEFNACGHCGGECDACQGEAKVAIAAALSLIHI